MFLSLFILSALKFIKWPLRKWFLKNQKLHINKTQLVDCSINCIYLCKIVWGYKRNSIPLYGASRRLSHDQLEQTPAQGPHCRGGGAYVSCVHFTHTKLCLIVPCHPVAPNLCLHVHTCAWARAVCGGSSLSAIENHIFGYTPFHTVIEISAFALLIHVENTEGVNQCPVIKPEGSEGSAGVVQFSQSTLFPDQAQHLLLSNIEDGGTSPNCTWMIWF